ncbi:hypothetical protein H8I69_02210 [Serratia fonticola]|uniref:hypothetical protein n=1 Tax=Serratia fonticola TaxID=47917 RepID=UPI0015C61A94|nr:hypothetical protein [Serratia fonticola]MBC3377932.1 hypothetical protein [Serratia fonticola]NYA37132.1 hypothetical protein [Serratia fonticola]
MSTECDNPGVLLLTGIITIMVNNGFDDPIQNLFEEMSKCDGSENLFNKMMGRIDALEAPFEIIKNVIGFKVDYSKLGMLDNLKVAAEFDERGFCFFEQLYFTEEEECLINSAIALFMIGVKNNGNKLIKMAMKSVVSRAISKGLESIRNDSVAKIVISKSQSEKASKPRHKYYDEVMSVIVETWKKYPGASQTSLHQSLAVHYDKKVSSNSLLKWIKSSGAKPPKPKKYTDFKLVIPQ